MKLSLKRKKYSCRSCRSVFVTRREYAGQDPFMVPFILHCCFIVPGHLYAHTFIKSSTSQPVICSGCGVMRRDRSSWQEHVQDTDCAGLAKTIFGCGLCGKIFTRKDNLREHLKWHAGVRTRRRTSRTCLTCGATFCGETMLHIHQKSHK